MQNHQAMHSMRRSKDWSLKDNMVNGLLLCARPTPQAEEGAIPHLYKQERKRPTPVRRRLSRSHAVTGRAIPGGSVPSVGDDSMESRSALQQLRIPSVTCPERRISVVVRRTDELCGGGYKWVGRFEVSTEWSRCSGSIARRARDSVATLYYRSRSGRPAF